MRWNNQIILDEVRLLHRSGEELNFCRAEKQHPHLVRAAMWHFGSWKCAVELAGLDYETVSKYRRWTRGRLIEAIREHHAAGHDLSWRAVSTRVDPALAAAALRPQLGFATWREAILAAGLDPDEVARYRQWTQESVLAKIREIASQGGNLSRQRVQHEQRRLYHAALRRFASWDAAVDAANLEFSLDARPLHHPEMPGHLQSSIVAARKTRASLKADASAR